MSGPNCSQSIEGGQTGGKEGHHHRLVDSQGPRTNGRSAVRFISPSSFTSITWFRALLAPVTKVPAKANSSSSDHRKPPFSGTPKR